MRLGSLGIPTNLGENGPSKSYTSCGLMVKGEAEDTAVAFSEGIRMAVGLSTLEKAQWAVKRLRENKRETTGSPGFLLLCVRK